MLNLIPIITGGICTVKCVMPLLLCAPTGIENTKCSNHYLPGSSCNGVASECGTCEPKKTPKQITSTYLYYRPCVVFKLSFGMKDKEIR